MVSTILIFSDHNFRGHQTPADNHMSRLVTNLLRVPSVSPSPVWAGGAASCVKQFTSAATNAPPNRNKNDKSLITAADVDNTLSYVSLCSVYLSWV